MLRGSTPTIYASEAQRIFHQAHETVDTLQHLNRKKLSQIEFLEFSNPIAATKSCDRDFMIDDRCFGQKFAQRCVSLEVFSLGGNHNFFNVTTVESIRNFNLSVHRFDSNC